MRKRTSTAYRHYRLQLIAAALIGSTLMLVGWAGPASASNQYGQEFINQNSHKCLDLTNLDPTNGNYIQQWTCLGNRNQAWLDGNSTAGIFAFRSVGDFNTDKCIDAFRGPGSDLVIWQCDRSPEQQWTVRRPSTNNDVMQFENYGFPGFCMDVRQGSTSNGAHMMLYLCHSGTNQRWT